MTPEVTLDKITNFCAGVGGDFVESVNTNFEGVVVNQPFEEFGVCLRYGYFALDGGDRSLGTLAGG